MGSCKNVLIYRSYGEHVNNLFYNILIVVLPFCNCHLKNVRHGFGSREYCKSSGYKGEWDNYVREGKGLMIWPNHDVSCLKEYKLSENTL